MNKTAFTYKITFKTPFIISSAVCDPARYDMVSLLSDGVPYVPASTISHKLKAVMRQHCMENERWVQYKICDGQKSDDTINLQYCNKDKAFPDFCPLCRIFGAPGGLPKAGFDFSGVRIPEPYHLIFKTLYEKTSEAAYTRRARNSIDPVFRKAREDALFSAGLADITTEMLGDVSELPDHYKHAEDIKQFDLALILLAMRLLSRIGRGINRGNGECSITPSLENWEKIIEKHISDWKNAVNKGGA